MLLRRLSVIMVSLIAICKNTYFTVAVEILTRSRKNWQLTIADKFNKDLTKIWQKKTVNDKVKQVTFSVIHFIDI